MNDEPTVFVVDDDKNILVALRFLLEAEDLKVETFCSARAFLSHYDGNRPGCLLLDLRIPGNNGLELQELLCARGIDIPIVIITSRDEKLMTVKTLDMRELGVPENALEYPVLLTRIHSAIAGHLEHEN
jgi:FixJ family two-component response regulator